MKTIQMRSMKIQSLVTPSTCYRKAKVKPVIKLVGNWLQRAGFEPGETAVIVVKDGVMTITPEDKYYLNRLQIA